MWWKTHYIIWGRVGWDGWGGGWVGGWIGGWVGGGVEGSHEHSPETEKKIHFKIEKVAWKFLTCKISINFFHFTFIDIIIIPSGPNAAKVNSWIFQTDRRAKMQQLDVLQKLLGAEMSKYSKRIITITIITITIVTFMTIRLCGEGSEIWDRIYGQGERSR